MSANAELRATLKKYSQSDAKVATWQMLSSIVPLVAIWCAMFFVSHYSLIEVVLLSMVNGFFLTRVFVLQHDCGHHTLYPSKKLNNLAGNFLSIFSFTPLYNWRREHSLHHSHLGNLDKVDHGDFWLMTVEEYRAASAITKLRYRIYRSPVFLFVAGPVFYLTVRRRFPVNLPAHFRKERRNVWLTDVALLAVYVPLCVLLGWKFFLAALLPTLVVASSMCTFGFFVQHTFEGGYWERGDSWSYTEAALSGSSYYDLPKWMRWFSADISVHHIHHLDSSIPNYNLQKCMRENADLQPRKSMSFGESLSCIGNKLWDEQSKAFVGYPR